MNHPEYLESDRARRKNKDAETMDLLKEVFVCVSIPVAAFAFAYITLDTLIRLFFG